MITEELYRLDLIKEAGVLHSGLRQKKAAKKELKFIKKELSKKSNNAEKFIFLLNRFISNYIDIKMTSFSENHHINISNPNYEDVEHFLLMKLKSFSEKLPKLSTRFSQFSPNYFLISPFFYPPEDWKTFVKKLIKQKLNEGFELTKVENDIKYSLSIFPSEFGLDKVIDVSVFSFFKKWTEAPLTENNILTAKFLNEKPRADLVLQDVPRKIQMYSISEYLSVVDFALNNIRLESKEKFHLNKSPKKLLKFLCFTLSPENETQKIQIEKFINNCFNWDNPYGSLRNHGNTITFLNRKTVKILTGCLWFLTQEKQGIIKQIDAKPFSDILIKELKSSNTESIGLSDKLRVKLKTYHEKGKKKKGYSEIFEELYPRNIRESFEIFH